MNWIELNKTHRPMESIFFLSELFFTGFLSLFFTASLRSLTWNAVAAAAVRVDSTHKHFITFENHLIVMGICSKRTSFEWMKTYQPNIIPLFSFVSCLNTHPAQTTANNFIIYYLTIPLAWRDVCIRNFGSMVSTLAVSLSSSVE